MSANITDIAALDEFRRALIKFREELGIAVSEADSEVKSTFIWLERDRMLHWKRAVPRLDEELTAAKSALYRKEMQTMGTGQRPSIIDEKKAVARAKVRTEEARERLERTRRWLATLERDVSMFKGAMSPLATLVDRDLPDAILRLRNMALALEAYLATPSVSLGEQLERARSRIASMRRAGEVQTAEEEAAATMGASRWMIFRRVTLPALFPSIVSGAGLSFSRALGEFGSVVMVAGNRPMSTKTAPLYVYGEVEGFNMEGALAVSLVLLTCSLLSMIAASKWAERQG